MKKFAASAALEDSLRVRACARPANSRERDGVSGSLATELREQHRGLQSKVAGAQPSGAEEIGRTGTQLGDYPQAFTHLGLMSGAVNLDHQLG